MINVFVTFCIVYSFDLSMYEIHNGSFIRLDFRFTYELCSVPNIIGVICATRTMGAVRIVKYKEDNYIILNFFRVCQKMTGALAQKLQAVGP